MRTHQQIIDDADGPTAVSKFVDASPGTVKQWRRLDSIPGRYWDDLAEAKVATLKELAAAAKAKAQAPVEGQAA